MPRILDFVLDYAGTITGCVSDLATGAALEGVTIYAVREDGTGFGESNADENGSYTITDLDVPGMYTVSTLTGSHIDTSVTGVFVAAGGTAVVDFQLAQAGVIRGQVTDESSSDPVEDALVASHQTDGEQRGQGFASTDSEGMYKIGPLNEVGAYQVSVAAAGYQLALQSGVVIGSTVSRDLYATSVLSATDAWAAGENGVLCQTTDGGSTWVARNSHVLSGLLTIQFVSATLGWAAGELGVLLKTTNGGATWLRKSIPTSENICSLSYVDEDHGWVVGANGAIFYTDDGGETWSEQTSGVTDVLRAVHFVGVNTGWAVGDGGQILSTSDGGLTWQTQVSGTSNDLLDVDFVSNQEGWAVGKGGTILHTTDAGQTCSAQNSGVTVNLQGVDFVDASDGWAAGGQGTILHTSDGGQSWGPQTSGVTTPLGAISFADSNTGWCVGENETILNTTDGGVTWTIQRQVSPTVADFALWPAGAIAGTVRNAFLLPIAEATVEARQTQSPFLGQGADISEATGQYAIEDLWAEVSGTPYEVSATAPGYSIRIVPNVQVFPATSTTLNLILDAVGDLGGRVYDALGSPVPEATVEAAQTDGLGLGGGEAKADTTGYYVLPQLEAPGLYRVLAWAIGHTHTEAFGVPVPAGGATEWNPVLRPQGFVSGTVLELGTLKPVSGADVVALQRYPYPVVGEGSAVTNTEGRYIVSGLEGAAFYDVTATHHTHSPGGLPDVPVPIGDFATVDFQLGKAGIISGTVSDIFGVPLSGAFVLSHQRALLDKSELLAEADVAGKYILPDLYAPEDFDVSTDVEDSSDVTALDVHVDPEP